MRTLAITSGKGGVGKTNISANLAIALACRRQRVVVFDADIGLANLDVVLGCRATATLQDVVAGEKTLAQVVHEGPGGIRFIPGGSGDETLFSLDEEQASKFLAEFKTIEDETDILIFDTGAGIDENVMGFLKAADEVFIVLSPDPASLTDGYATAKALYRENPAARVKLVFNMVASEMEARQVFAKLYSVGQQFLNVRFEYGGFVRLDPGAVAFIRKRVPFMAGNPNLPASVDLAAIAARYLGEPESERGEDLVSRLKSLFRFGQKTAA